jgi:hypothetical protein
MAIAFVEANETDLGRQTADQNKLLELRQRWREDLIALQSERMLVYTPVTAPGSVARCLWLGERVCAELERPFAPFPRVREPTNRMRLLLYESQREYLRESRKALKGGAGHLAWTDGHTRRARRCRACSCRRNATRSRGSARCSRTS